MTTRRSFLKILGGGTILATAAAGAFVATRTPAKALAPWDAATGYSDPIKRALAHALLAPNPHNRQPWLVDLGTPDQVTILRDTTRELPMTDPYNRQIFIGMGCFLENLVIAATQTGHAVDLDILPAGDDGPVAVAHFRPGAIEDPLARAITARHSDKDPYSDRPIAMDAVTELSQYVDVITAKDEVESLRQLTWDALRIEIDTDRTFRESADLIRVGKREINANPDGIEMRQPHFDALYSLGLMSRAMLEDKDNPGFQSVLRQMQRTCFATPAYAVLTTPGNTRHDQIATGRTWMRYSLAVTALGLGTQPMSQAIQEFPEMSDLFARAHKMLARPRETVQMLARLGYGSKAIATPRWGLETRIVNA